MISGREIFRQGEFLGREIVRGISIGWLVFCSTHLVDVVVMHKLRRIDLQRDRCARCSIEHLDQHIARFSASQADPEDDARYKYSTTSK
jgi:hypothetical protein